MTKSDRTKTDVRYDWAQVRSYWENHASLRASSDQARDPEGLDIVCHTGAPLFVNRYYGRGQRRAYLSLLAEVPPVRGPQSALDVGCGTGRWSQVLHDRGYQVTGIDLQRSVVAESARRHPTIRFEVAAIQTYTSDHPFNLISTVTVLQHLPYDEQRRAVDAFGRLVSCGGHAIALENVSDRRSPTVFANTIGEWAALFASAGFDLVASRSYDFSPALRTYYAATRPVRLSWLPSTRDALPDPDSRRPSSAATGRPLLERADRAAKVAAACVDTVLEPALFSAGARLRTAPPAGHVAALFRRR